MSSPGILGIQTYARINTVSIISNQVADLLTDDSTKNISASTIIQLNNGDIIDLVILSVAGRDINFAPDLSAILLVTKIG